MTNEKRFKIDFEPKADEAVIVKVGNARFTIITSQLIRIEYSNNMDFEDRASQVFWYRKQPVPQFKLVSSGSKTEIITDRLHLHYIDDGREFNKENLYIELKELNKTWHFSDWNGGNLLGTKRTLDAADGEVELEPGLLSREGWVLFDDSNSLVINEEGWVEERKDGKDYYFFGYGHEYLKCLKDFSKVSGSTSLIPKWALGNWWSRYWEYSDKDLMSLMTEFKEREIPLSVCIVDMDWHIVKNKYNNGWTGYTWNKKFFPEPEKFIDWLHDNGLRTALNLHPADGVYPHEDKYSEMAQHMGIDPTSEKPIKFDIVDRKFMEGYLDILHHPIEEQGVDFWWLDWQQGNESKLKKLDPLFWLNHVHFYDLARDGVKRPFTFSRYGGPGSHRYPIGFSGDTIVTWNSLAFQPYFTVNASNIAYSWWSHDIGGHFKGTENSELNTRWLQFGVFSPILRIHSGKNIFQDRRPWANDAEINRINKEAMQLRHTLIPYIYTMAWRNHTEAVPLMTPMYYHHAEEDRAYRFKNQYYFGSELIVSPYITKRNEATNLSRKSTWLPEGEWFNFFTGEYHKGDKIIASYGKLDDIPVFAKAGAIVPLNSNAMEHVNNNPKELDLLVFPGRNNEFALYEDDGETLNYSNGKYAVTRFKQNYTGRLLEFSLAPVEGDIRFIPGERIYNIKFKGIKKPDVVEVNVNGANRTVDYSYDKENSVLVLKGISVTPQCEVIVKVFLEQGELINKEKNVLLKCENMLKTFTLKNDTKGLIYYFLPKIVEDLSILSSHSHDLEQSQFLALIETIKGEEVLS